MIALPNDADLEAAELAAYAEEEAAETCLCGAVGHFVSLTFPHRDMPIEGYLCGNCGRDRWTTRQGNRWIPIDMPHDIVSIPTYTTVARQADRYSTDPVVGYRQFPDGRRVYVLPIRLTVVLPSGRSYTVHTS